MRQQLIKRLLSVALHALLFFIFSVAAFPPQFVAAETPQLGYKEYQAYLGAKKAYKAEKQAELDLTVIKNTSPTKEELKAAQTKYDDAKAATDAAIDEYSGATDANVQAAKNAMGTPPTKEQTKALTDAQAAA